MWIAKGHSLLMAELDVVLAYFVTYMCFSFDPGSFLPPNPHTHPTPPHILHIPLIWRTQESPTQVVALGKS